jgi:hypothetical protein
MPVLITVVDSQCDFMSFCSALEQPRHSADLFIY